MPGEIEFPCSRFKMLRKLESYRENTPAVLTVRNHLARRRLNHTISGLLALHLSFEITCTGMLKLEICLVKYIVLKVASFELDSCCFSTQTSE